MKEPPTRRQATAASKEPRVRFAFMPLTLGTDAARFKVHFRGLFGDHFPGPGRPSLSGGASV